MLERRHFESVCTIVQNHGIVLTPDEFELIKAQTQHKVLPAGTVLMKQGKEVK
jgi:hypothetical protein